MRWGWIIISERVLNHSFIYFMFFVPNFLKKIFNKWDQHFQIIFIVCCHDIIGPTNFKFLSDCHKSIIIIQRFNRKISMKIQETSKSSNTKDIHMICAGANNSSELQNLLKISFKTEKTTRILVILGRNSFQIPVYSRRWDSFKIRTRERERRSFF